MYLFKKVISFILLLIISFNYAFCQQKALVSGNFKGLNENDKVYLNSTQDLIKDTADVVNGVFKFTKKLPKEWGVYFVSCQNKSGGFNFPLFLNQNSKLHLEVNNEYNQYKISGDKNAEEQNDFWQRLLSISEQYRSIEKDIEGTKDSSKLFNLKTKLSKSESKMNSYYLDWVTNHKSSPFSVAVIRLFIAKSPRSGIEDTLAERYFDSLLPEAKENNFETDILESQFEPYNDKYSKIKQLELAPGFTLKDTSGNEIKLSDFNNKYLLIDFWASWCGPCRANNPELKKLYNTYKAKGLNVLSISMDTDASKWKTAIKKDGMDWFQGSDLLGQAAGVGLMYRITAIPKYILIGPDKKIISKSSIVSNLNLVEEKLKKTFQ